MKLLKLSFNDLQLVTNFGKPVTSWFNLSIACVAYSICTVHAKDIYRQWYFDILNGCRIQKTTAIKIACYAHCCFETKSRKTVGTAQFSAIPWQKNIVVKSVCELLV